MIWLFQQLWPLMLIALILGVVCTWLWMVRKVEAERATARTTSRVSTATTPVHADVAAKKTADSTSAPKEKNVPVASAVGATAAGAAAATYAVGRFGQGSVDALPDGSQPHGYDIKGNADSMLYHTTDSPSYRQCKAEVWFRDEESAQAAGFRRWDAPKQPVAKSAESKATDAKVTESKATDAKATDAAVAASKTESDVAASVSAPRIVEGTADAGTAKFVDATAGGERSDALPAEDDTSRVHQAGAAAAAAGAAAGIAAGAAGARGPKPSVVEGKDNVDSHGVHEAPAGGVTYAVGRFGEGSVDPLPGGAMPVGYSIKGNADSMKYHTLESPSYSQCKAEVWFKDESSAQLAGFARWDAKAKADDVRKGIAEEPKTAGLQGEAEKPLTPVAPSAPTFSAADDASGQGERLAAATAGVTAGMYAAGAFGEGSVDPLPNGAQPVGYAIKGNAQSMLFHTEQSPSYGQCKAEVWFRDEATAEAAGFKHWDSSRRKAGAAAETAAAAPTYPEGRFGPGSVDPLPNNAQPEGYDIKGNAQSMLFHTPESPSYKVCIAEVWFADEESAKAAGFKHWDRRKRGL